MDPIDPYISGQQKGNFESWQSYDHDVKPFFDLGDTESTAEYVDLLRNPERYTGYAGDDATKIWLSIYKENCFLDSPGKGDLLPTKDTCYERTIFFRLISGMHANVNLFLSSIFPKAHFPGKIVWDFNLDEFESRFLPENTNNKGGEWIRNIFLLQSVMASAIVKAENIWKTYKFITGSEEEENQIKSAVLSLVDTLRNQPCLFNESSMFVETSGGNGVKLMRDIKKQFFNISQIMDCVGCEKCRLWGKLQIQGIGTALQILFSPQQAITNGNGQSPNLKLSRSQVVALFNAFHKYTFGIHFLQEIAAKMTERKSKIDL